MHPASCRGAIGLIRLAVGVAVLGSAVFAQYVITSSKRSDPVTLRIVDAVTGLAAPGARVWIGSSAEEPPHCWDKADLSADEAGIVRLDERPHGLVWILAEGSAWTAVELGRWRPHRPVPPSAVRVPLAPGGSLVVNVPGWSKVKGVGVWALVDGAAVPCELDRDLPRTEVTPQGLRTVEAEIARAVGFPAGRAAIEVRRGAPDRGGALLASGAAVVERGQVAVVELPIASEGDLAGFEATVRFPASWGFDAPELEIAGISGAATGCVESLDWEDWEPGPLRVEASGLPPGRYRITAKCMLEARDLADAAWSVELDLPPGRHAFRWEPPETTEIAVRVVDEATGNPVPRAKLRLEHPPLGYRPLPPEEVDPDMDMVPEDWRPIVVAADAEGLARWRTIPFDQEIAVRAEGFRDGLLFLRPGAAAGIDAVVRLVPEPAAAEGAREGGAPDRGETRTRLEVALVTDGRPWPTDPICGTPPAPIVLIGKGPTGHLRVAPWHPELEQVPGVWTVVIGDDGDAIHRILPDIRVEKDKANRLEVTIDRSAVARSAALERHHGTLAALVQEMAAMAEIADKLTIEDAVTERDPETALRITRVTVQFKARTGYEYDPLLGFLSSLEYQSGDRIGTFDLGAADPELGVDSDSRMWRPKRFVLERRDPGLAAPRPVAELIEAFKDIVEGLEGASLTSLALEPGRITCSMRVPAAFDRARLRAALEAWPGYRRLEVGNPRPDGDAAVIEGLVLTWDSGS